MIETGPVMGQTEQFPGLKTVLAALDSSTQEKSGQNGKTILFLGASFSMKNFHLSFV